MDMSIGKKVNSMETPKYKEQIYAGEWDVRINQDIGAFVCGS